MKWLELRALTRRETWLPQVGDQTVDCRALADRDPNRLSRYPLTPYGVDLLRRPACPPESSLAAVPTEISMRSSLQRLVNCKASGNYSVPLTQHSKHFSIASSHAPQTLLNMPSFHDMSSPYPMYQPRWCAQMDPIIHNEQIFTWCRNMRFFDDR